MEARMRKKVPSGRKTYRVLKAAKDDRSYFFPVTSVNDVESCSILVIAFVVLINPED